MGGCGKCTIHGCVFSWVLDHLAHEGVPFGVELVFVVG
jgi:hypothetical protein